jgi:hypothetical protein
MVERYIQALSDRSLIVFDRLVLAVGKTYPGISTSLIVLVQKLHFYGIPLNFII